MTEFLLHSFLLLQNKTIREKGMWITNTSTVAFRENKMIKIFQKMEKTILTVVLFLSG